MDNVKATRQKIRINLYADRPNQEVTAAVYGALAITKSGPSWVIIHVPTGLSLKNCDRYAQACLTVYRLLALPIDWQTIDSREAFVPHRDLARGAL